MRSWLARWFGGRKVHGEDEPARFAAPSARPIQPVTGSSQIDSSQIGSSNLGAARRAIHARKVADKVKSGFDPYNSGSFNRGNAWERVIRR